MAKPPVVTTDANTLANIVIGLGGTPIPGRTFQFELPRENVREAIPIINQLGVRCRTVDEKIKNHPTRLNCQRSVLTIELYKSDEPQFNIPEW
jgi:hypothetical protein